MPDRRKFSVPLAAVELAICVVFWVVVAYLTLRGN